MRKLWRNGISASEEKAETPVTDLRVTLNVLLSKPVTDFLVQTPVMFREKNELQSN